MNKRIIEISSNLLFWIVTSWLILSSFSIQSQEIEVLNGVESVRIVRNDAILLQLSVLLAISLVMFYTNSWNLKRLTKTDNPKYVAHLSLLAFGAAIGLFLLLRSLIWGTLKLGLPVSLVIGILIFYFTISTSYALILVWLQSEINQKQLKAEKTQAELTLLRNQLQPHFLFNVLNNQLSMIDQIKNPALANSMFQLSDLLRYVVYDSAEVKVSVQKEIDFIKNYTDLQLLRFDKNEVTVNFSILGDNNHLIEPGLFVAFVENAFKYGTEPELQTKIDVTIDLRSTELIKFTLCNPILPHMQQNHGSGSGISNVKKRLQLIYPEAHQLDITEKNETYCVHLNISTL